MPIYTVIGLIDNVELRVAGVTEGKTPCVDTNMSEDYRYVAMVEASNPDDAEAMACAEVLTMMTEAHEAAYGS